MADEALGVQRVGGLEDDATTCPDELGPVVVDVGGRVEADAGVAVLVVVPSEKTPAKGVRVLEGAEALGEVRTVLERAELGLGIRVVVAHVRPGVALGHTEVREQEGNRLGGHRGAAIGVDGELVARDALLGDRLGEQRLGKSCPFCTASIQPTT